MGSKKKYVIKCKCKEQVFELSRKPIIYMDAEPSYVHFLECIKCKRKATLLLTNAEDVVVCTNECP